MTEPATDVSVLAVMALEWMADADPRAALSQADTGLLAERIGHDLSLLVPEVASLDLVVMGAHFDPAEVLRPGWPVHRRLHELQQRAPGRNAGPRILAFGTDARGLQPVPMAIDRVREVLEPLTGQGAGFDHRLIPAVVVTARRDPDLADVAQIPREY